MRRLACRSLPHNFSGIGRTTVSMCSKAPELIQRWIMGSSSPQATPPLELEAGNKEVYL